MTEQSLEVLMKGTGYIREREIAQDPRWPIGLEELRRARRENLIRYTPGCRTYWYRPEWIETYIATKTKGPPCPDPAESGNTETIGSPTTFPTAIPTMPTGTPTRELDERERRVAEALKLQISNRPKTP
jgi:hypothetical protein